MKVLLVCKEMIAYERTAIMLLASNLKKRGHKVKAAVMKESVADQKPKKQSSKPKSLLHSEAYEGKPFTFTNSTQNKYNVDIQEIYGNVYKIVKTFQPDLIGYSVMTGEHYDVLKLNKSLKKHFDFVSVMGGPHPTFNKQVVEEDGIDAICTGEGDSSFPEFIRRIESGEEYWLTKSFHVKYKGEIYRNSLSNLVEDLNELPFPDRQVLYDADPNLATVGAKSFISARGCPYKCSYCFNKQYNDNYKGLGQTLRVRSPELVIQEIEGVRKRYPLDTVTFTDDVFTLRPPGWIKEFSKLYKERIALPFNCTARASSVKKQDIRDLKDAGLTHVWMGVECGDEEAANKAIEYVENLVQEVEVGKIYLGKVKKIVDFGAFVEIFPGTDGLVHISQVCDRRIKNVSDEIQEGDEIKVKVIDVDQQGKVKLSRKEALKDAVAAE